MNRPLTFIAVCFMWAFAPGCTSCIDLTKVEKPFPCSAATDCPTSWRCSADQRCFDPRIAPVLGMRCTVNDQCADGWRCGETVNNTAYCLEKGVGATVGCVSDEGCEGGFRCSYDGTCFDPATVAADAGTRCLDDSQCADDSRCGQKVNGARVCLKRLLGAPVPCLDDEGCSGGWRCDTLNAQCVDVDDVVATGQVQQFDVVLKSPQKTWKAPTAFGLSAVFSLNNGQTYAAAEAFDDGDVVHELVSKSALPLEDGGRSVVRETWFSLPMRATPFVEAVASDSALAVRNADNQAWVCFVDGGSCTRYDDIFALRATAFFDQQPNAQQGTPKWWVMLSHDGGLGTVVAMPSGELLLSVPQLVDAVIDTTEVLAFSTLDGGVVLQTQPAMPPRVQPMSSVPEVSAGVRLGRLVSSSSTRTDAMLLVADGGRNGVTDLVFGNIQNQQVRSPLPACPDDTRPLEVWFGYENQQVAPLARCRVPMVGVVSLELTQETKALDLDRVPYALGATTPARSLTIGRAHAGNRGRWWYTAMSDTLVVGPTYTTMGSTLTAPLRPFLMDRQPSTIVLLAANGSLYAQAGVDLYQYAPGWGFVSNLNDTRDTQDLTPLLSVPGNSNWVVSTAGIIDLTYLSLTGGSPRMLAKLPTGVSFAPPVTAQTTQLTRNGVSKTVVLVTSHDALWLADVTEAMSNPYAPQATLAEVLVPAPGLTLRSLTLVHGNGNQLVGFVSTSTQAWRFATPDFTRWALTGVHLPPVEALPFEVWTDADGRARAGFSDGTVWALPVMVQLAEAIPASDGGVAEISDFARLCGDTFASTDEGVFHLTAAADAGLATWARVDALETELDVLGGARLYESESSRADAGRMFVSSTSGRLLEVSATCTH